MTKEERATATGFLVEEYAETRKQLASVLAEAARLGDLLEQASGYLKSMPGYGRQGLKFGSPPPESIKSIPASEKIVQLCQEGIALLEKSEELKKRLRDMGLDLRD